MTTPASIIRQWSNLGFLRLAAFGFGITGLFLALDTVILPVLVLQIAPEGLKNTYLGVLGFAGLAMTGLAQVLVGGFSDHTHSRWGRRVPYLLVGCVLACVGIASIGLAHNYWALLGAWLFLQVAINVGYVPYQALIRDLVPARRIGVASSLKVLAESVGGVGFIFISGTLLGFQATGGGTGLWLTLGILAGTLVVVTLITTATVRGGEKAVEHRDTGWPRWQPRASLKLPQISWLLVSRMLMITAITCFQTYGLFFLRDVVGLDNPAQALGHMVLAVGAALVLTVFPAGWLSDRIGRKPVVMAGALGAALSTAGLLTADNANEVLVIGIVMGMSVGALLSAGWALVNDLGTTGREAQYMGIVALSTAAGALLAKALGPVVDLLNHASPGSGYTALLIGCGVFLLAGSAMLIPLDTRRILRDNRAAAEASQDLSRSDPAPIEHPEHPENSSGTRT
ncbi:MAG: MFS transporter [Dehalococcoidia bacterium]|nr:MFS transporter [Dehalococcoidia bacterium]MSQ17625.1 MFS transporter [Dehalococcoidia bacterium]